jgi:hypothetical protein
MSSSQGHEPGTNGGHWIPLAITYVEPTPTRVDSSHRDFLYQVASGRISFATEFVGGFSKVDDPAARKQIKAVRLEVAPASDVVALKRRDGKYRYFKAELGLNMIVPKGKVTHLRFLAALSQPDDETRSENPVALDGFPRSDVDLKALVPGKFSLSVSNALRFLPIVGQVPVPVDLELGPWEFRLGSIRQVKVQFSGGLTSWPEWFATKKALVGEFRVAVIVRCPLSYGALDAAVQAYLRYDPGFWHKADIYTQEISIPLLRPDVTDVTPADG